MTVRAKLSRFVLFLACTFAACSLAPSSVLAADALSSDSKTHESPFACVMSALSPAERKQHFEEYGPRLRKSLKEIRELSNGYEFAFATDRDTYEVLSAWMFQERLCCPFFDLELRIDREGGATWLRLTGRDGVKDFIRAEFDPWFRRA